MSDQTPIQIYVACLASYNAGILHGTWIDALQGEGHIIAATKAMLGASPIALAEEWAIHDQEGFPDGIVQEYSSFKRVAEVGAFLKDHSELGAAVLRYYDGDLRDAKSAVEERYQGQFESLAHFAQDVTEGTTVIPESLQYYIDYEKMADDMTLTGDVFVIELGIDQVHVFYAS